MKKIKYSIKANSIKSGMLAIFIRCEQFGKQVEFDTNVRIFYDEWDEESGCVVNNPNSKKLNMYIRKTLYQLEEYELNYDGDFTLSKLKELWDLRETSYDFYKLMDQQIFKRDIKPATKDIHRRVLMHLRRYKESCSVGDLTEKYAIGFIQYMKNAGLG